MLVPAGKERHGETSLKAVGRPLQRPRDTKDRAQALAVDELGNVYVIGDSGEGSENFSDYVTVKYNASGVQQWVASYNSLYDYATDLALDPAGNVYVAGYSHGFGTSYDYATVSYSPAGLTRWLARFGGGLADDYAYAVATDASGNVYVTGETVEPGMLPPPPPHGDRCVVPKVVGLRLAAAKRKLRHRLCRMGWIRRARSKRVGRVLRQRPKAGAIRRMRFPVALVVGRR